MTATEIELMIIAALLAMLGVYVWLIHDKVTQVLLLAKQAETDWDGFED